MISRRSFLGTCAALGTGCVLNAWGDDQSSNNSSYPRKFHLSVSTEALDADPGLLEVVRDAGVADLWLGAFFYGQWPFPIEKIQEWRVRIEQAGMGAHIINIPLGHPGDSLQSSADGFPITPPGRWRPAMRPDGTWYLGTSHHPPATEENQKALIEIQKLGVKRVFLDDDFRLAISPGMIGGCFCNEHKKQFLDSRGYAENQWAELLDNVKTRTLTPLLRAWVEFTCDQLTACFRAQQQAVPDIQLGNMVMYFGAEKAGIRLTDYANVPLRVGELMFNDDSFNKLKNKTAELFSCLFHRRFVSPENAFSETTAFPSKELSAANMAAKLTISTIADVRNTMYMSGVQAFPKTHWETLKPAMKHQAQVHEKLAGHIPRGPFKHYWGEASRYVGTDEPFSLFLAAGVPFEVTDTVSGDGWTFLSDDDARHLAKQPLQSPQGRLLVRPSAKSSPKGSQKIEETPESLFAFKRKILPQLSGVPYVEEDKPVVCAWYPTARSVLLWNLSEDREAFTVRIGEKQRSITLDGLASDVLDNIPT
ncbi:MAG TPA: hypothetical protein PLI09_13690 [Candidatus Hydrogenedentes bacterium]|nr:hypothetical protein [Candidatus Hydrogenedentota bacterium]